MTSSMQSVSLLTAFQQLLWLYSCWYTTAVVQCDPRYRLLVSVLTPRPGVMTALLTSSSGIYGSRRLVLPRPALRYLIQPVSWYPVNVHERRIDAFQTASTSFVPTNTTFNVQYASGSASGILGSDTVEFAGFEVQSQTFGKLNLDGP